MTKLTENEQLLGSEFDRALSLRNSGDLVGAREQLLLLLGKLQPADRKLLAHSHMQLGNIAQKLGLHGTAELTKYAVREGLTSLDD